MQQTRSRKLLLSGSTSLIVGYLLAAASPALAQVTPPDAGQTLRENQQRSTPRKAEAVPTLSVPDEKDPASDPKQRLSVSAIRIRGNVNVPVSVLQALVADREGKEQSLGDLRAGVRRITTYYRERGYVVARAFIPAQTIENGIVIVQVLEGTLVGGEIDNHSAVGTRVLKRVLDAQRLNGKVIHSATTDRGLLLLADLPSVGKVAGKLKPGDEVGTSNLIVSVGQGDRFDGMVTIDNYGNRYTGEHRLNGQVQINSPAGLGDRLSLQGTVTSEEMLYGRVAYDLPVGGQGLRVGADFSNNTYQLGKEFASLDASGRARTGGVYALYPLVRSLNKNVWLSVKGEARGLRDTLGAISSVTEKSSKVATLEAYGDIQDGLLGGGYNTWSIGFIAGDLNIQTPAAVATDRLGPKANGGYSKFVASISRLQAITSKSSVSVSLSGQLANKNLDSSEKFVIGGIYGVRAYPQGEGVGDSGWLANLELRHQLNKVVRLAGFFDVGSVRYNKDVFAPGSTGQILASYGASASGQFGPISGKVTVAMRASGVAAVTSPDRSPRVWATLGYHF